MLRLTRGQMGRRPQPQFVANLTTDLGARSAAAATFTRATVATVEDWEGRVIPVLSGEARFKGARRVRNLMTNTQTFTPLAAASTASWTAQNATDPFGGSNAGTISYGVTGRFLADNAGVAFATTYSFSFWARTTSGVITTNAYIKENSSDTARGNTSFTATTAWQRIFVSGTTTGANCRIEIGNGGAGPVNGTLQLYGPQLQDVAGQFNLNASEFVGVGLLSSPYYLAGVDGVRNFDYQPASIACWGDSLSTVTMPNQLRSQYDDSPVWVYDGGAGSETSTQIKTRLLAASAARLASITVIWAGRNNFSAPTTVKADIAAMIAALGHTRYIVLSVLNGEFAAEYSGQADYLTITALNRDLAALYPNNYIDIRSLLVAQYDPAAAQDVTDFGRDIVPASLRIDAIHLTPRGYNFVAEQVKGFIDRNWSTAKTYLPNTTLVGYMNEEAKTQLVTPTASIRDMTDASWVKSNMTTAYTSTGADGKANSGTRCTATAANATILQTLTAAATSRTYSCRIRRVTGTGNIEITQDGTNYTNVTSQINSLTYTRVSLNATQLNASFGIRLVTSGDAIDVDFNQFESGAQATTPIVTAGATRNADVLTWASAGNADTAAGTIAANTTPTNSAQIQTLVNVNNANTTNAAALYVNVGTMATRGQIVSGGGTQADITVLSGVVGTRQRQALYWRANDAQAYLNGTAGTQDTTVTVPASFSAIYVGSRTDNTFPLNGPVRDVRIWTRVLPQAQIVAASL